MTKAEKYLANAKLLHGQSFYLVRTNDNTVLATGKINALNAIGLSDAIEQLYLCSNSDGMCGSSIENKIGYRYSWHIGIDIPNNRVNFHGDPMDIEPYSICCRTVWPIRIMIGKESILDSLDKELTLYDLI